jgi:hypothetical protein
VIIIALIVYYTRPRETKTPDQTSDTTELKVENLTFERTLNPDPSVGDGVSGYTIEPYGIEYATGETQYKELSENVTFTMNWTNAPGFNNVVKGFKIEHFVRKEGIDAKPTKVEQIIIKTPVTEANTDKDNISIADFGVCRAKIVSVGTGAKAYAVIGQNSFKLYAVVKKNEATDVDFTNTATQKFVELYDGRDESDADAAPLKISKDQLSATMTMTSPITLKYTPARQDNTSSRTLIDKTTYNVSNYNNSTSFAGVYLTTVKGKMGKEYNFTYEDGKFLLDDLSKGVPTNDKKKFTFEIVDRPTTGQYINKGKIRRVSEGNDESTKEYLSTTEGNQGTLKLYKQKDSSLNKTIFDGFIWTFSERIAESLEMPPQTVSGNNTGDVVCISGDYALVGQPGFNSNKGRVIAYTRNASGDWNMQTPVYYALPPNDGNSGKFGASISIDGDYALIGEPDAGRAYLAKKVKGVWEFSTSATTNPMVKITPTGAKGTFGTSVSISGNFMVIGQPGEFRVHLYKISKSGIESQNVKTIQFSIGDFGGSVSISGDRYIVGAKTNGTNNAGSVVIYKFNKTSMDQVGANTVINGIPWKGTAPTAPLESNLYFGTSVAIQGEYAFVGAPGFNQNNGRVYVYKVDSNGGWTRANGAARKYYDVKMVNNNTGGSRYIGSGNAGNADDTIEHPQTSIFRGKSTPDIIADMYFGTTLDISGNKLVIGSEKENKVRIYTKNETTVYNGEETGSWNTREIGTPAFVDGKVVIVGPTKVPIKLIEPPFKQDGSKFGASVSIDGDYVIIGEPNKTVGTAPGAGASYITDA